ncbi:MAG: hypothetical protein HY738_16860 [Bacteroidia bacterium]|nr:hypothetical protein [Bacteroidia bacterium]
MRTKVLFFTITILLSYINIATYSQNIAITDDDGYTAHPSAMLDVKSTNKGVLLPRLTTVQRNAVINPATGLLVFDTEQKVYYFYNGTQWVDVSSGSTENYWTKNGINIYLADSTNKVGVGTSSPIGKLDIKADPSAGIDEPILNVINKTGDTVLAVYNSGVRIYVADDPALKAAGSRSGFAVGGFSITKGLTNEYLRVTPDSVRVYIEDTIGLKASGNRGGFAVGGFSLTKGINDSLYLFSDRTGFNVTYLTQTERDAITNPRLSSIIFNTTDSCLQIYLGYWESIWCTPMNCIYPTILTQPVDSLVTVAGGNVFFAVSATGSKIYYKWQERTDGGSTWKMLSDGGVNPQYSGTHTDTLVINNIPVNYNLYKYRCLVSNACGSELSSDATLFAGCGTPFTDSRDSKIYNTVLIGTQCWMAENLNFGTMINSTTGGQFQTDNAVIEKYCYSNNSANCSTYGGLYEWNEMMQYNPSDAGNPGTTQGICPSGWHIPTDAELTTLTDYLGGESVAGGKMKEIGTTHWTSPNTGATNESGCTALRTLARLRGDAT